MFRILVVVIIGLASLWTVSLQAQEAVLGQLYGSGVHAYFSYNYSKAYTQLSAAINAGSRDPRAFYFRGLAELKLGYAPQARMDFQKGAQLESRDVNRYYNVGRALERVQGSDRQSLESYRVQARMAAFAEAERIRKARYEAIKREEARVLQQQAEEGARPSQKPAAAEAAPAAPEETNGKQPAEVTKEEEKPAEKKDTSTETGSNTQPAGEDPFAAKSDKPEKPAAENKPADENRPAAENKPADENKPANENKPTDEKKSADENKPDDDPFAN